MVSILAVSSISLIFYILFTRYKSLQRNIFEAKQSGLPYKISPVYFQEIWWLIAQDLLLPILRRLPEKWTETWLPFSLYTKVWHVGHAPFAKLGHDTFMLVSPGGNIIWTCEPEVIHQLDSRGSEFIKPVEMMGMLNIYGPTLTASEGEEGRLYRKITAPSFNDENHRAVWIESIKQAGGMLKAWNSSKAAITSLQSDIARLTLHVFSSVCFARDIEWTNALDHHDEIPKGHTLSYPQAISAVLANTINILMTPKLLLRSSPLQIHKKAQQAFVEWRMYMEELRDETQKTLEVKRPDENKNLLEAIVKAGQTSEISPAAVLGNIFIFVYAGHETSANTLVYAMVLLACRPAFQRALQADLDEVLGDRPQSEWSYKTDFPRLLDGYAGAVMNETLRLYAVLPFLPKTTEALRVLKFGDRSYTVPARTVCMIHTSATHRNPKFWPEAPSAVAGDSYPFPVSSFDPSMWLKRGVGSESASTMLTPEPGSYVPFAEGHRSCIGKRFAQTEFCALIAAIFKEYSVELAVGGSATAEEYSAVRQSAEQALSTGVGFTSSLKMNKDVPLRLVRRGEEKWVA